MLKIRTWSLGSVCPLLGMTLAASAAHAQNVASSSSQCTMWIDAKTGGRITTFPQGTEDSGDPNHRTRPSVADSSGRVVPGKTFFRGPDGSWNNAATGQPVNTYPQGTEDSGDPNHRTRPSVTDSSGQVVPGKDFVRVPCPPPLTTTTQTPPVSAGAQLSNEVPPVRGDLRSPPPGRYRIAEDSDVNPPMNFASLFWQHNDHLEIGIHGGGFFEPGTTIGEIGGSVGYRFSPLIGVELQADFGISKEKTDYGSTFRSATGISWAAYPLVVLYVPVLPNVELFGHGGYGVTRFNSSSTFFSGSSSTSFAASKSIGTGVAGGGVQWEFDQSDAVPLHDAQRRHQANALRLSYDRLFFDNGTAGNRVMVTFVHAFGR